MTLRALSITKYNNTIDNLDGNGLSSRQADIARGSDVRAKFRAIVDAVINDDAAALSTAHNYVSGRLTEASVKAILNEIEPNLARDVAQLLGTGFDRVGSSGSSAADLRTAFNNVKSLLEYGSDANTAANRVLKRHDLTLTSVAYADGHRTWGVSGDYIADITLESFEPGASRRPGSSRPTMTSPIVKDSNWTGPFGVIDLASFSVQSKNGSTVSLKEVLEDPARHVNNWKGPDRSFFDDGQDEVSGRGRSLKGPKAAVMDTLVPVSDGSTDTVPTIYTYGKPMLVLVAVPGEGVSAHYTDGSQKIRLPIHESGREKALRITRASMSDRDGPTSFDRGSSAVDDMLINSALIIQIPVNDPDRRPRRSGGPIFLESLGGAASFSFASSTTRGLDSGNFGTEAGVVSAGGDLGRQKDIPQRITRTNEPIRADFVLYAATDANVVSDALASRMRRDMDSIIDHPNCAKASTEN
jgi:hypothetical protein